MSPGQMWPGQMSTWQLTSVKEGSRNVPLKFGQNQVSNSWDITNMDKCCQGKCCLAKCHRDSWHLLKVVPERWLWSLVKIGSVTDEISDMDKCCQDKCCIDKYSMAFVEDVPMNLHLNFGQNRVSNSWNIPDMDKCRQDKWWLDNCHPDSWNIFKMVPGTDL